MLVEPKPPVLSPSAVSSSTVKNLTNIPWATLSPASTLKTSVNKFIKLNTTFASLQSFNEDLELDFVDKVKAEFGLWWTL